MRTNNKGHRMSDSDFFGSNSEPHIGKRKPATEEADIITITNRFATTEFALAWSLRAMETTTPAYRAISQPYYEGELKHAPIAVDCEKVIPRRAARR